jgi:UDP-glucose 6-dehydrogenase
MNKDIKVNILGYGQVGQATGIGLKKLGYDVVAYDIKEKPNLYNEIYFNLIPLIVGTELPTEGINIVCIADKVENGKQDISHIKPILEKLTGTIILRTTIIPRLLKDLKFDFYWVEFLKERSAIKDFLHPERVVVGRREIKEFPFEKDFYEYYYSEDFVIDKKQRFYYCTPEEASHIKYLSNNWNSLRIALVNQLGDNLLKENASLKNIIDYFFDGQKYLKYGNGFGGFCLPKDIEAYVGEYPQLTLLAEAIKANEIHKKDNPELETNPVY